MKTEQKIEPAKSYHLPVTVDEALQLALANERSFRYIAGGTDVMVNRFQGNENSSCLIDLGRIPELTKVKIAGDHLSIGAGICLDDLVLHPEITDEFPILIEAVQVVGSPLIRSSATLGGNVLCENRCSYFNQSEFWRDAVGLCLKCEGDVCIATGGTKACFSKFVSDTAPALISMDAQIEIVDKDGISRIPLEEIYTGDGLQPINLPKTTILKSILLPLNKGFNSVFRKLRQRESLDFSSLTAAVSLSDSGKLKISLGGVDPKPVTLEGTSKSDLEDMIKQVYKKCRAIDNDSYPRIYRKEMIKVFLKESFGELGL